MKKKESEFGNGCTYCLGLFLAHEGRYVHDKDNYTKYGQMEMASEMWFNAASDHLYELVIPDNFPSGIKRRLKILQDKALNWGHGFPKVKSNEENVYWALNEAKKLLLLIDKFHGIPTIKGSWE